MKRHCFLGALLWFATMDCVSAETVRDRKGAILQDRANLADDPRWIYNDYERGFAEARATGKPLLVVLRCIPCLACGGLDARVLQETPELGAVLDQFVCVRVINANNLDLERFQFDFDLSFSATIFNGDGTVYGRYGSWTHQTNPQEAAVDGFRKTLEAALKIHQNYPTQKSTLAGKQPRPSPFKTPLDMPTLKGDYSPTLDWEGNVVQSCVHCHQIGDALRSLHRQDSKSIPLPLIYPFPQPETLGLKLALNHRARVKSVNENSPAAQAGILPGDDLLTLAGQPILSVADISWVLHHAPDSGSLPAQVQRNHHPLNLQIPLPQGWRNHSDISHRVGTWSLRAQALGGLRLEDMPNTAREKLNLSPNQMALRVQHLGQYGPHAAAKNAGFQKNDLVIKIAGLSTRTSESELIGFLLQKFQPGQSAPTTILRQNHQIPLNLPIQ